MRTSNFHSIAGRDLFKTNFSRLSNSHLIILGPKMSFELKYSKTLTKLKSDVPNPRYRYTNLYAHTFSCNEATYYHSTAAVLVQCTFYFAILASGSTPKSVGSVKALPCSLYSRELHDSLFISCFSFFGFKLTDCQFHHIEILPRSLSCFKES